MSDLRVELLAVEACPHFEATRRNLEAVLHEGIIETPIQVIFVGSADDAEFLEFPGSPTVRINGVDIVPEPGLPIGLGCRIYRDESGAMLDGPPVERMRAVVHEQRQARLQAFQRGEARTTAAFARAIADEEAAEADGAPAVQADRAQADDGSADTSMDPAHGSDGGLSRTSGDGE